MRVLPRRLHRFTRLVALLAALSAIALVALFRAAAAPVPRLPPPPAIDPYRVFVDLRPITVSVTLDWIKMPVRTTRAAVTSDPMLWRMMHFEDWDALPADLRREGLRQMLARFGGLVDAPARWPAMTASAWDAVPQPIRALAFMNMIRRWSQEQQLGARFDRPPRLVADTLCAIAMAESWFEHRGEHLNADGTRDLGLGGTSEYARGVLADLAAQGAVPFHLSDRDYFNPFDASWALTYWFGLMLQEADGQLELAIRAYHVGIGRALDDEGKDYLDRVRRLRQTYMRGPSSSPTWRFLASRRLTPIAAPPADRFATRGATARDTPAPPRS
jgi:hypothetical protein